VGLPAEKQAPAKIKLALVAKGRAVAGFACCTTPAATIQANVRCSKCRSKNCVTKMTTIALAAAEIELRQAKTKETTRKEASRNTTALKKLMKCCVRCSILIKRQKQNEMTTTTKMNNTTLTNLGKLRLLMMTNDQIKDKN
jgi:hypothetical protein